MFSHVTDASGRRIDDVFPALASPLTGSTFTICGRIPSLLEPCIFVPINFFNSCEIRCYQPSFHQQRKATICCEENNSTQS